MLANIKADLNSQIMESSQALDIDRSAAYAAELKEGLDAKHQ